MTSQTSRLQLSRCLPPALDSIQAEKLERRKSALEKTAWSLAGRITDPFKARLGRFERIIAAVDQSTASIANKSDMRLRQQANKLKFALRANGFTDKLVATSFALVKETARRTLGMSHFDCQLLGGRVILAGMVAEMETGEGKTLTATLPAVTAAIAGYPVHVVSVNDYLTARDAEEMSPLYNFLELSVGCVTHEVDHEDRKSQYNCDVTYCCNKDLTFDYLRDRIVLGSAPSNILLQSENLFSSNVRHERLMQRGLHFAILDEVDSILIDDARTPLIISASHGGDAEVAFMQQAYDIASSLKKHVHFQLDTHRRMIYLTIDGRHHLALLAENLGPLWVGKIRREETVHQALTAQYLFHRDEHYIVSEGKVQIVDENTGRVMPDRSWERGLHQQIELKEDCEPTQQRETQAKMSYQRFFSRYLFLSGMTGTASEVKKELWDVYGLRVVKIPTNKPNLRAVVGPKIMYTEQEKWQAVVEAINEIHATGAPILVGTKTVRSSEHLCQILDAEGLSYRLLNAKQDKQEAQIVAEAGRVSQITIATNMAGRGTDIKLESESRKLGGLHVILTERFEAGRIDRQLAGRCARQGDAGVYLEILSLSDLKEISYLLNFARRFCTWWHYHKLPFAHIVSRWLLGLGQRKIEQMNFGIRRRMVKVDERQGEMLSFSGRFE